MKPEITAQVTRLNGEAAGASPEATERNGKVIAANPEAAELNGEATEKFAEATEKTPEATEKTPEATQWARFVGDSTGRSGQFGVLLGGFTLSFGFGRPADPREYGPIDCGGERPTVQAHQQGEAACPVRN